VAAELPPGRRRQAEIFQAGVRGRKPAVPVDPQRLEEAARERLSAEAFAYLAGGAGLERTMRANRDAFDRRPLVPRVLRDVSRCDTSVELFGRRLPAPFLLAPIGVLDLARTGGDVLAARAATAEGVPFVCSSQASTPVEDVAAATVDGARWYQLYWSASDELATSFVRRAEASGCEAIVVTLDTTMLGWRPRDLDLGYLPFARGLGLAQYTSDPVFQRLLDETEAPPAGGFPTPAALRTLVQLARSYPGATWRNLLSARPRAAVRLFLEVFPRPSLDWDDLARLRAQTQLPIVLKGVLHPDDARQAIEIGLDGVIVSNHGGRQVDGAIASLDALGPVVAAVDGRMPVLFDSGIRTGSDVVKALALGARAVLLGRPYAYGLAVAGETGVREVIRNLAADLELTLRLTGCRSLDDVGPPLLGD
jgi:lactate 2-monooxygenase